MANGAILTAEQERKLRQPIDEYVGKIQKEIDELREHGTAEVIEYQNLIANVKRDKTLSKGEKESEIKEFEAKLSQAKAVEAQNKDKVAKLISDAESYLKENFEKLYYNAVKESCEAEKAKALEDHKQRLAQLEKEHKEALAGMSDQVEIKEENYVHKNRISNEKLELEKEKQLLQDRMVKARYKKIKVEKWMANAPARIQRLVRLKYFERLSWEQVAERIGGSTSADSARMELKKYLKK